MLDTIILFLCSGICGTIQNNFVVKMKHPALFPLIACCFASVILPFLYVKETIPCLLYTLLSIAVTTLVGGLCYYGSVRFRLYNLFLQHIITLSALFMADALSHLFGGSHQRTVQIILTVVFDLIWVGGMLFAHLRIFTLIPLEENNYRQSLWYCGYAIIILLFAVIVRKEMAITYASPLIMYVIFAFLSAIAVFAMILALQWNSTAKPKMLMEKQFQAISLQNTLLTQRIQDEIAFNNRLKKIRHDYRSHLTALSGLLEAGQQAQAQEMLKDVIKSTIPLQGELYCENSLINVVLRELAGKCKKLGTEFYYTIRLPQKLSITDVDLTALLMNITNNAVECCQKLHTPSQAFIHIFLFIQNEFFVVKCENTVDSPPQISNNRISSTKYDPDNEHGIGLESIHYICEKYEGRVSLQAENQVFTITALLKNEPPPG